MLLLVPLPLHLLLSSVHTVSLLVFLCIQFSARISYNILQVEHWLVLVGGFAVDEQPNADVAWRLDVAAGGYTLLQTTSYSSRVLSDHR